MARSRGATRLQGLPHSAVVLCFIASVLFCRTDAGMLRSLRQAQGEGAQPEHERLFKMLANLAEDINEKTGNLEAAVQQLRTAFVLCPACEHMEAAGKFREAFSIDNYPDRLYLTRQIFPALMGLQQDKRAPLQILWAGSHPYTLRYEYLLKGAEVVSIDPNQDVAVYGSSHRHIVDILQRIGHYTDAGTFDVAVVNGVIGWGINTPKEMEDFLRAVFAALKPSGYLIVGYNRHMGSCCSFEPYFEPSTLNKLPQRKNFEGQWKHTYEIYRKINLPEASAGLKSRQSH